MEPVSRTKDNIEILEDQIREFYGRVVWTHKTHEKAADITLKRWNNIKTIQIIISTLVTSSLVVSIVGNNKISTIISAIISAISLGTNLYLKNYDLGKKTQQYIDSANKLWNIRELYLSLLVDIRSGNLEINEIREKRDRLQEQLSKVYETAPRTSKKFYSEASVALKQLEELTFSDDEIDKLLPRQIRKKQY